MAVLSVPAAGYTVTVDCFQWGYTAGKEYGYRNSTETEFGASAHVPTGVVQRQQKVRFVGIDAMVQGLRQLALIAGRKALPVTFDDGAGHVWSVEWPEAVTMQRILDNRQSFEVALQESV